MVKPTFNNFKQVLTNPDFSKNSNLTQPKIGFQNVQVNHNSFDFLENRFRFDQKNEEFINACLLFRNKQQHICAN